MVPHFVRAQSAYKNIGYTHFITHTHTHTHTHALLVMDWKNNRSVSEEKRWVFSFDLRE